VSFICGLKVDKKVLFWIILFAGVVALILSLLSCTNYEDLLLSPTAERQSVNEKCFCVFNKGHLPVGEFLIEAGKDIDAKLKYHGWKTYRVRVLGRENLERVWEIHTIVVYYEESDE